MNFLSKEDRNIPAVKLYNYDYEAIYAAEELSELDDGLLSELPVEILEPSSESNDELLPESPMKGKSEAPSKSLPESLTHGEMARRLIKSKSTLSDAKKRPNFPDWSKNNDPDHIAWTWDATAKVFVPVDVPTVKTD
jgi:hypothetical protein